jgi:DNA polymerase-3 subunit delta'
VIVGQDRAVEAFASAWSSRKLHHAWLFAGPKGVGKATFANMAARKVLGDAAGPAFDLPGVETPDDHPVVKLVEAGSHPDMRWLQRIENPKAKTPGTLYRNIIVDQIRQLGEFMGMTAALSAWRVAVIDMVDDLEPSGANALLKMLEEPPSNTLFFLVSHAPGRLLPTIRSRCRLLYFEALSDDAMTSILETQCSGLSEMERKRIVGVSFGSAGRALAFAELGLAKLEDSALAILRQGDPTNLRRAELANELGKKASAERYAAFLELAPSLIAREARSLRGASLERALDAYEKARELAVLAPRASLDASATVFQIGGFLAEVADQASLKR